MRIRIPSLLASLAFSLAAACGGADVPAETAPAAAAEPIEATPPAAAAAEEPATPVAGESAAAAPVDPAAAPTAIEVAVQNLTKGQSGPSKKPASATATSGTNQITVHLESFSHYCSPAPTFTAAVEGEKLVVTLARPASAVSRCVAPHSLDAVVSLPGRNNVRTVVVVDASGKELASATVTSGK